MIPKFYISPFFINKFYLYKETKRIANKYNFRGTILDIGCGVKPYKELFPKASVYHGIDFNNFSDNNTFAYKKPDFFFDKKYNKNLKLNFKDESYDNTVSFQVLEHHRKPDILISEMYRITKLGGLIFISVPFLGGIHEEPHDYQRFTKFGLIELFGGYKCRILELESYGSVSSVISMLMNENLTNFTHKSRVNYLIGLFLYPPFLIFQYISLFLNSFLKSEHIVSGYLMLVKKI